MDLLGHSMNAAGSLSCSDNDQGEDLEQQDELEQEASSSVRLQQQQQGLQFSRSNSSMGNGSTVSSTKHHPHTDQDEEQQVSSAKSDIQDEDVSSCSSSSSSNANDDFWYSQPTPWRQAILTCLGTAPGRPSRHLALIPFLTGLVFIILWHEHYLITALQIIFGIWSLGPVTALLWYVPFLTRHYHGGRGRGVVINRLLHKVCMPLFVIVMSFDVILSVMIMTAHSTRASRRRVVVTVVTMVLLSLRMLVLALTTVEPAIQTYRLCTMTKSPFYPCCLLYWCCPVTFRQCHQWIQQWQSRCCGGRCCCCCCCRRACRSCRRRRA